MARVLIAYSDRGERRLAARWAVYYSRRGFEVDLIQRRRREVAAANGYSLVLVAARDRPRLSTAPIATQPGDICIVDSVAPSSDAARGGFLDQLGPVAATALVVAALLAALGTPVMYAAAIGTGLLALALHLSPAPNQAASAQVVDLDRFETGAMMESERAPQCRG